MDKETKRLWGVLMSPEAEKLSLVLGDVQKDGYPKGYADWKEFVKDVMEAMEMQDSGQFPDELMP